MKHKPSNPVQQLTKLLESGQYPLQSRLPPERVLAIKLGITRTALRKALSVLEAENKIWRHVGRGTYVGARPTQVENHYLPDVTNTTHPAEIMEARQVLEPKIAAIAAFRATQNDLEQMEHCLLKAEDAPDFTTFEHWDSTLHTTIAESSHNLLLISLFKTVNNLRQDRIWGRLKEAAMTHKRQKTYIRQHRDLVAAIQNRDATNAEKIMRNHLETVQKNLLSGI